MSRLSYPLNGLKSVIYDDLEQAKNYLSNASMVSLSKSDSYSEAQYVFELSSILNGYHKRLNHIMNAVIDVTNTYTELEEDLNITDKNITSPTLKARERLIK